MLPIVILSILYLTLKLFAEKLLYGTSALCYATFMQHLP